jgi:hypothetical protein
VFDPASLPIDERAAWYAAARARTSRLHGSSPGERLLELLAEDRAGGVPFNVAWERALPLCAFRVRRTPDDRAAWLTALADTRQAWRRAYRDERAAAGEDYAARIAA